MNEVIFASEATNNGANNEQLAKLRQVATEPTPQADLRWRDAGGGKKYPYTDPDYVIRKLNDIFGFNWSFIVEHEELIYFNDQPFEVKVRGRLMATIGGQRITKMQYGAATIEWMKERDTGKLIKPVMIADAYKSAASDALKKAASEFGIAHDVYDSDSYLFKGNRGNQQQQTNGHQQQTTQRQQGTQQQQTRPQAVPAPTSATTQKTETIPADIRQESADRIEVTDALLNIWMQMGKSAEAFTTYRAEKLKGKTVAELRAILEKWQAAAFESQQTQQTKQSQSQPETQDRGSGLDQWRCTKESNGSRRLALSVIEVCARLEATGLTEAQWREQLNDLFSTYEPPVSRKTLSLKECEDMIHVFTKWAEKREKDAAAKVA